MGHNVISLHQNKYTYLTILSWEREIQLTLQHVFEANNTFTRICCQNVLWKKQIFHLWATRIFSKPIYSQDHIKVHAKLEGDKCRFLVRIFLLQFLPPRLTRKENMGTLTVIRYFGFRQTCKQMRFHVIGSYTLIAHRTLNVGQGKQMGGQRVRFDEHVIAVPTSSPSHHPGCGCSACCASPKIDRTRRTREQHRTSWTSNRRLIVQRTNRIPEIKSRMLRKIFRGTPLWKSFKFHNQVFTAEMFFQPFRPSYA